MILWDITIDRIFSSNADLPFVIWMVTKYFSKDAEAVNLLSKMLGLNLVLTASNVLSCQWSSSKVCRVTSVFSCLVLLHNLISTKHPFFCFFNDLKYSHNYFAILHHQASVHLLIFVLHNSILYEIAFDYSETFCFAQSYVPQVSFNFKCSNSHLNLSVIHYLAFMVCVLLIASNWLKPFISFLILLSSLPHWCFTTWILISPYS